MPNRSRRLPPPRRVAAVLALLAAIAVVVAIMSGTGSRSPRALNSSASTSGAATVERRDLVETDTESGTLSYANPRTVYDRLSGTITWLPAVGEVIKPGEALFKVNGEPVLLMDGSTPAYRDLSSSDTAGQDILELNRNLVKLGFNPAGIAVNDTWQAATTAGVDALQASLGETETGSLTLGQVVFLPGDQLVSTMDATAGSSTNASDPARAGRAEFVDLKRTMPPAGNPGSDHKPASRNKLSELEALIALLKAEIAELRGGKNQPGGGPSGRGGGNRSPSGPSSSSGGPSSSNGGGPSSSSAGSPSSSSAGSPSSSGGGGAQAVLETTSTRLIVTVGLDASKQSEAKVGEPVSVEMPAGNTVDGRIIAVSPVAQSSNSAGDSGNNNGNSNNNSSNSGSTVPVTIALSGRQPAAGLDQAAVSVEFSKARASNVLSVPVTALLAAAGGGYAVQEAAAPHALIPVTTGLFATGYVQISGAGIYAGLAVTDSQG